MLQILGLALAGYPIARTLNLKMITRLICALQIGLVLGPAVAWLSGVFLDSVSPDTAVWALSLGGLVVWMRDVRHITREDWSGDIWGWPEALVAAVLAALQMTVVLGSGWYADGLHMTNFHAQDGSFHLSNAAMCRPGVEFSRHWPPPLAIWSGQRLQNYHPLSDVLLSLIADHDAQVTAYFRTLPLLYALMLSLGVMWVLAEWGASRRVRLSGAAMCVLCGSLGHLANFYKSASGELESRFWLGSPFSMLYNPPTSMSAGALFFGLAILCRVETQPVGTILALSVLWGAGLAIKVFLTALALPALALATVMAGHQHRRSLGATCLAVGTVALCFFSTISNGMSSLACMNPFWPIRLLPNRLHWISPEQWHYFAFLGWIWVFLVYIVGNLGIRVVGVPAALREIIYPLTPGLHSRRVASSMALGGFLIPLVWASSTVTSNTTQFSFYTLVLLPLWATPCIVTAIERACVPSRLAIIIGILFLSFPTSWETIRMANNGVVIPISEIRMLQEFAKKIPVDGIVAVFPQTVPDIVRTGPGYLPGRSSFELPYVPFIMVRQAFLVSPVQAFVLHLPVASRLSKLSEMAVTQNNRKLLEWAWSEGIRGIYSWKDRHPVCVIVPPKPASSAVTGSAH